MASSSIKPASFRVDEAFVSPRIARATTTLIIAAVVMLAAIAFAIVSAIVHLGGPLTPFIAGAVALAGAGIAWRQIMRRRWLLGLVDRGEIIGVDEQGVRLVRDVRIDWSNITRIAGAEASPTTRGSDAFVAVTVRDVAGPAAGATPPFRSVVSATATGGAAVLFLDAMPAGQVSDVLSTLQSAARAAGVQYGDDAAN